MHIRCAANRPPHVCLRCAHSLCCQQRAKSSARRWLCTFSALPANSTAGTMAYNSAGRCCCAHPLCCQQDMLTRHFLNMQSVPAVHILCAASTHHGRIRSMLLSLYVECICCAHSLCCQQRAKSSARRWLCTFSALPANSTAGTMAYNSAGRCCCAHPLCCQQDRLPRHFSQYAIGACCAHSLRCQHTSRPHS